MSLGQLHRVCAYRDGRLTNRNNYGERLKALAGAEYLTAHTDSASKQRLYTLAKRALEPLGELYGIVQRGVYRGRGEGLSQIRHPLIVSEWAVRVVESLRDTDVTLVKLEPFDLPFYHAEAVGDYQKRRSEERFITQEEVDTPFGAVTMQPDLVFAYERNGAARLAYVEIDRATEGYAVLARKLSAYEALTKDAIRRYSPSIVDHRVLFITTTEKRIRNTITSLGSKVDLSDVCFTTFGHAMGRPSGAGGGLPNLFFSEIWHRFKNGETTRRALLTS